MSECMATPEIDFKHYRLLLVKLRDDLMEAEESGLSDTETVELDQTRIGRLSRMDAMQTQQMALESQRRRKIQIRKIGTLANAFRVLLRELLCEQSSCYSLWIFSSEVRSQRLVVAERDGEGVVRTLEYLF